jgi:hypothetical protein
VNATIANGLGVPVAVRYEEAGHEADIGTLKPGEAVVVSEVFTDRGPSCHGPFVARATDGREVARALQVCPGGRWTVLDAAPSHS